MKIPLLLATAALFASSVVRSYGYGAEGHTAVGDIAAERLRGTPTGARVNELLDGVPLGFAATIPDRIKSWDRGGGADDPHGFKMPEHPKIEAQLRAFWQANRPGPQNDDAHPSHHTFHVTAVPIVGGEKYADGKAGRSDWDIVHAIDYCCGVLTGKIPEQNDRAITKAVAVILLAHFVGDIHQPMHAGAEYFDGDQPANPDSDQNALSDLGGNTLLLVLAEPPGTDHDTPRRRPNLHGFWDTGTVKILTEEMGEELHRQNPEHPPELTPAEFAHALAKEEPADWKMPANLPVQDWAEAWVNEILPVSREAHAQLDFSQLHRDDEHGKATEAGVATERPGETPSYTVWSAGVVRTELPKAGYRLAAMLTATMR